jgi:hypothetical protein
MTRLRLGLLAPAKITSEAKFKTSLDGKIAVSFLCSYAHLLEVMSYRKASSLLRSSSSSNPLSWTPRVRLICGCDVPVWEVLSPREIWSSSKSSFCSPRTFTSLIRQVSFFSRGFAVATCIFHPLMITQSTGRDHLVQ